MKNSSANRMAFTLVEIMIVMATIGLLATIAIPNFVRARTSSFEKTCINNLRQIDSAKQQWALENKKGPDASPLLSEIVTYIKYPLLCPVAGPAATFDTSYNMETVATRPTCKVEPLKHVLTEDTVD